MKWQILQISNSRSKVGSWELILWTESGTRNLTLPIELDPQKLYLGIEATLATVPATIPSEITALVGREFTVGVLDKELFNPVMGDGEGL